MGTHFSKHRGHHSGVMSGHEVMVHTFMSGTQCRPQRRRLSRSSRRYSRSSFSLGTGAKTLPVQRLSRSPSPVSLRLRKLQALDPSNRASIDLGRLRGREERLLDTLSR